MGWMEITDRALHHASHLVGPGAASLLDAVVSAHDGEVVEVRPSQVAYRPGHDLIASYSTRVRWSGGEPTDETLLVGTTREGPLPGTLVAEADGVGVGVWRYPFDPVLPGLDVAVRADALGALLGVDPATLELTVRSFRPTRRAVVEVRRGERSVFVKVLPPARVSSVVRRHERLRSGGVPVPEVLLADHELGLVVLSAVSGIELRERITTGGALPSARALCDVVAAFAAVDLSAPDRERPGLIASAARHTELLRRIAPSAAPDLDEVLAQIEKMDVGKGRALGAHGDLHDGQIFLDEHGRITGIIDVDDAAPGDPIDDLARPIAHLVALSVALRGVGNLDGAARAAHLARRFDAGGAPGVDRSDVRARVAAALLGLASGPFRSQDQRWEAAVARLIRSSRTWARLAGRGDEKTLSGASPSANAPMRELT